MNSLRKLSISTLGAIVGLSSLVALPLLAASPAAADPSPTGTACTPTQGLDYTDCLRFDYTGGNQTFHVPDGVTSLYVQSWGAGGGGTPAASGLSDPGQGGGGAYIVGLLPVTSGQSVSLKVGEGGQTAGSSTYGGGGSTYGDPIHGASGGGASTVAVASILRLVAGGGGGAGSAAALTGQDSTNPGTRDSSYVNYLAGGGGGATGANSHSYSALYQGGGATASAGGAASNAGGPACETASSGGSLSGGDGAGNDDVSVGGGGGGGGGYFGGGGGGCFTYASGASTGQGGGGGGGSSFFLANNTTYHFNVSGQTQTTSLLPAATGNSADDQYETGVGVGSSGHENENTGHGGNGEIVIQYTTDAPTATNLTSTGVGTASQQVSLPVPDNGSSTLLDGTTPTNSVDIANQGTYELNPSTGDVTFTPVLGFTGTATAASYRVATQGGNVSDVHTYTASVTAPPGPTAVPLYSSGSGTDRQSQTPEVPPGGTVTLISPTTTDDGVYSLDGNTIIFRPALGFVGAAAPVDYHVSDSYSGGDDSTYFPTVTLPSAPNPGTLSSTGTGTDPQSPDPIDIPAGGHVWLLDGQSTTASLTTADGSYSLDTDSGVITFTPNNTFQGDATPIHYQVTDAYLQQGSSTYQPHVNPPGAPTAAPLSSIGTGTDPQSPDVTIPDGGSISLLNGESTTDTITTTGEGTYVLDPDTHKITFTPVFPFKGDATPVPYRLTDRYGQSTDSTYTPHVNAPNGPYLGSIASSGYGTDPQTTNRAITIPTGGSITLLNGSDEVTSIVTDHGHFTLNTDTGFATFTPVLGYTGSPTPVTYQVTDAYGTQAYDYWYTEVLTPDGPTAAALISNGAGTTPQTANAIVPPSGTVALLGGDTATSLTDSDGSYALDADSGIITFTPALGFTGVATPINYELTDAYGSPSDNTYTATVTLPAGPTAAPITSGGTGTDAQIVYPSVPAGGSLSLVGSTDTGHGTYTFDTDLNSITFSPVLGYTGTPAPVTYRLTDAYNQHTDGTYTPTVTAPSEPNPAPVTSTGIGNESQTGTVTGIPDGGSVALMNGENTVNSLTVDGQGTYQLDGADITFTPATSFHGNADPINYRVTDAYGQHGTATFTAHVDLPGLPTAGPLSSTGTGTAPQSDTATIPDAGSITLLDGITHTTTITDTGKGTYTLDSDTGEITFTPVLGYSGNPDPITYQLTDQFSQSSTSSFAAHVDKPNGPTAVALISNGTGTAVQNATATIPDGGSAYLVDGTDRVNTITVTGKGTYTLDTDTGEITFVPVLGFQGDGSQVTYGVTDAYNQDDTNTYSPFVFAPTGPSPLPLTSTGIGTAVQHAQVVVPDTGTVTLLNDGTPTESITINGQGTYTLDSSSGIISFAPVSTFAGDASPITYGVTDAYGTPGTAQYTPHVNMPGLITAAPLNSSDTGTAVQTANAAIPSGGSVTLLDAGDPTTTVTVDDEGTFVLNTDTGVITFTPTLGFSGNAVVHYRTTDRYSRTSDSTYTAHVALPAGPTAGPLTSHGTGTANQTATATVPSGGFAKLIDTDTAVTTLVVPDEGSYTINPTSGLITFTPVLGFQGDATAVTYRVQDAYGQLSPSTYTPQVNLPAAPSTPVNPHATVAYNGIGTLTVPIPDGGSIALLNGNSDTSYTSTQGSTWTLNQDTGVITFTAATNKSGDAGTATYRVTDAYDQHTDATYSVTVAAGPPPPAPPVAVASATAPTLMKIVTQAQTMPVTCQLTVRKIGRCDVTLTYTNSRGSYVVGTGSVTSPLTGGSAGRLVTQVTLNSTGHYLAALGTVPAWVTVSITPYGSRSALTAITRTAFVNYNVKK